MFHYSHFRLGIVAQFLYVGAQVGTWSYYIQYIQRSARQPEKMPVICSPAHFVAFGAGRFIATYMMKFIAPTRLMGIYAIVNTLLVAIAIFSPGWLGVGAIFATSFFMSLMFPTIFALAIKELGPNLQLGGSVIVMSIIGGGVIPMAMGKVSDITHSMAISMLLPMVCYIFITYYAFSGSRVRIHGLSPVNA